MPLSNAEIAAARNRKFKEPLKISGYKVVESRLSIVGENQPRTNTEMVILTIETVGDLAKMDARMKTGKFIPVPDLSIQALNIVIDKMGLLEPKEEEKDGA